MPDFEGDRHCTTHHGCGCLQRKAAELHALREGLEAEVERLRTEAEKLKRTEADSRYGPVVIAEAHVLRIAAEETADRLTQLLQEKP